ncbi:MAG: hypothetical protein C4520_06430 [Candidatus Abyssobacteria bacterium SURF_5]|uniref:Fibronectin type-III domain-containing protein n=1 Tax=Abyssobacteria bacterium (strain SURF_5) TaxID=2093360 RepID=A0A3A4P5Z0_ABYX5|nr:MAG: hypothetical protein C4520_06430 [Candidatus Abyssubacteria bacterium SURF_5]
MGKRLIMVAVVVAAITFAAPAFSQEIESIVEIFKEKTGSSAVYEGDICIEVEGEGITAIALKHASLPKPITILQNLAGFDEMELVRDEEWSVFTNLIPNGLYELMIAQGALTVRHPFEVNYSFMPALPTITSPTNGQVMPSPSFIVTWNSPPAGIDGIYLEIESEVDLDSGYLPPTATYYVVPDGFLKPGSWCELDLEFHKLMNGTGYSSLHQIEFSIAP